MKVTKKMKRFAALLIAAVVMLSGVPLPSVQAAGEAKGVDVLAFAVKNEKGTPVPGVRLTIFNGTSPTGKNLESNASGMVRWTPEASDDSLLGSTLTVKPVGPETTDAPLTFELEYIYSSVGRIEIKMINGQPASEVSDPVLVVKGGAAETQDNKKQLVVNVKDQNGNPVDGCAFVMKDSAFPDAGDGLAKYPSNGVVKFTLSDGMQFGGTIRVHSMSSADYEGNELTFTSKNKEFLTVNGEAYDGIKEYTIVVTKKGEEPEVPEVNKAALEQKITEAKAIKNENYTEASWNALQAAITAAEAVRDNEDATQDDVDAQVTALETAINALEEKEPEKPEEVNKDELKKAIDAAKAIENKNYTEASWNALQAAIAAAEAVRNDADATQDDVDAQVTALKNAVDGLKENSEKPNPEKPNPEKPNTNKPNTNKPNIDKPNADKNENAAPKTGDSAPFVPCVAGMICAAAVAGMALKKRKSFE